MRKGRRAICGAHALQFATRTMLQPYVPRRTPEALELQVRGLRHHVTRWAGTDPDPVFLLHGWMDTGDTFQFLVDALPECRTCIAPDWRGFGRSEWPADGYWFPDYYADLEALLDHFAPGNRVTLVGHSMGGNIATMYAGIRPERVRRVVCIEGFGLSRTRPEQAPARYREWLDQVLEPPKFARFPSVEAFAHLLARRNPRLTPERAAFIGSHIVVDPSRGPGHAQPWEQGRSPPPERGERGGQDGQPQPWHPFEAGAGKRADEPGYAGRGPDQGRGIDEIHRE